MSRLEQLLTHAMENRAGELWMAPGQPARVRIGREWKDLGNEVWAAHETKALLSSPLSEFDKREFFERGFWTGSLRLVGKPLQLHLQLTDQGIAGAFRWRGSESLDWDSWNLPPHTLEVLTRTRGLSLVCGPQNSGRSSLLFLLAQKLGAASAQMIHFYSDTSQNELPARVSSFPLKSLSMASHTSADIILIDEPSFEQWPIVLDLAESGRHLVFSMTGLDLFSGLERWKNFHQGSRRPALDCVQMAVGTRLVSGLENLLVPAVDLLLVPQKLRNPLKEGNWPILEEEMRASGEKTGMRTLNQSLLQLVLRRKIELRTAFHESRNPDEFDALLKKVGI